VAKVGGKGIDISDGKLREKGGWQKVDFDKQKLTLLYRIFQNWTRFENLG